MAKVTARNGKLVLDFTLNGVRLREQTSFKDNKTNRKKLDKVLKQILADIENDCLDYRTYFPVSKLLGKIQSIQLEQSKQESQASPTLDAFAEIWFQQQAEKLRPHSLSGYKNYYQKRILPYWEKTELASIKREDILEYQASLLKMVNPENGLLIKPATVNRSLQILRLMLDDAATQLGFESPFVEIPFLKVEQKICPFTEQEVEQIIAAINPSYRAYILVWFFTGLRTREINGLRWRSVNLQAGVIHVIEVYCERVGFRPIKGEDSNRVVHMSLRVHEALVEHYKQTFDHLDSTVFKTQGKDTPVNNSNFCNRAWKTVSKKTGIAYRSPAHIRHTTAVIWLKQGMNPTFVAKELGATYRGEVIRTYGEFVPSLMFQKNLSVDSLLQRAYQSTAERSVDSLQSINHQEVSE
jgi:integrase